jgi:hypothetical protein
MTSLPNLNPTRNLEPQRTEEAPKKAALDDSDDAKSYQVTVTPQQPDRRLQKTTQMLDLQEARRNR